MPGREERRPMGAITAVLLTWDGRDAVPVDKRTTMDTWSAPDGSARQSSEEKAADGDERDAPAI